MRLLLELLFYFSLIVVVMGCGSTDNFVPAPTIYPQSAVATSAQCPTGGIVVQTDANTITPVCNGSNGANGTNGSDADSISIVQFCPGTTTYPSQFNEVGFCYHGQVYGTYSANGGFSTLLPPGSYNSNGIGSSCSFTILSNCQVQ